MDTTTVSCSGRDVLDLIVSPIEICLWLQAVSTEDLKKIVDEFNELEGFKGSKGDSPFTVARQQPQLDSALLYSTMIDLICEELKKVLKAFSTDDCFMAAGQDNSEWKMVCSTLRDN